MYIYTSTYVCALGFLVIPPLVGCNLNKSSNIIVFNNVFYWPRIVPNT